MRYVNTKEAASVSGRPQRSIERWARLKVIKARRVGCRGHYEIALDGDDLDEWLVDAAANDNTEE